MKRSLSILIVLIGAFHGASGQKTAITSSEFYDATQKASKPVDNPVRSIRTEEFFQNGVLWRTSISTFEGTPGEASRLVVADKSGSTVSTREEIELGDWLYSRIDKGKWNKEGWYFRHPITESVGQTLQTLKFWKEYFPSEKVTVYHTSVEIDISKARYVREEEYYISTSGASLKTVTMDKSPDGALIVRRKTFTINHDSSIKIEAPVE